MRKKSKKGGFTLIEILVVVLIIGLLAAVILASLGSSRDKGSNGAIRSGVDSLRKQAEVLYNNMNLSYGGGTMSDVTNCVTSPSANTIFNAATGTDAAIIAKMVADINLKAGGTSGSPRVACSQQTNAWAFSVVLKAGLGTYCVDSRGNSPKITSSNTTADQGITDASATCS
jgi:prepilin-type N-terminal cleavage/methylation domain-containing protein